MRYVALLRGINVGGKNIIKMPELRNSFERMGFRNVSTYIQSGNVLFESSVAKPAALSDVIEEAVAREFGCNSLVVVVSQAQLEAVVLKAPPGYGADPARFRYDVVFMKPPLSARQVLPAISLRKGVDEAQESNGVLYFSKLIERATQSLLPKLVSNAAYRSMTIRNWNTTRELCRLLSSGAAG
jgi:uncharacterized protein (DUF1697 family)